METANPEPKKKRRRPMSSCEQCRRRKVKCDQNSPCGQCIRSKAVTCTYNSPYKPIRDRSRHMGFSTFDNASLSASSLPRTETTPSASLHQTANHVVTTESHPTILAGSVTAAERDVLAMLQTLTERVGELETRLAVSNVSKSADHGADENGSKNLKGLVVKNRLFGRSHFMYVVAQGYLRFLKDTAGSDEIFSTRLERCKILARSIKTTNTWHQPVSPNLMSYIPPKEIADELVKAYFRTSESVHRILHIPTFHEKYNKLWQDDSRTETPFMIQVLLVLAIGAVYQHGSSTPSELCKSAEKWICVAHTWLTYPFTEKQLLSITGMQTYCLFMIAREAHKVGGELAWINAGSLFRIAVLIGLHQDPSNLPNISTYHAELRRRLWATVLEICCETSMTTAGPPLIDISDSDCRPPLNIDDDQIGEKFTSVPLERHGEVTQTAMQRFLLQTLPLRLQIATALNDARTELNYAETLQLGAKLSKIYQNQLIELESVSLQKGGLAPIPYQKKILQYANVGSLSALHLPFAIKARWNQEYYYSRKTCLDAALMVLKQPSTSAFDTAKMAESYLDCENLNIRVQGHTRSILHLAALVLCMELTTQGEDSARFMDASHAVVRREIRNAIEYFATLTFEKLKAGELNVKSHVFACSLVAQINALENGNPINAELKASLRPALQKCLTLLEEKAGAIESPVSEIPTLDSAQDSAHDPTSDMFSQPFWLEDMDFDMPNVDWNNLWDIA